MGSEDIANAKSLWKNQQVEPVTISLAELQRRAQKFEKQIGWRNLQEYAAGALVVVVFGYYFWRFPAPLARIGCALMVAGTLYVVHALHKRGAAKTVRADMAFQTCLAFHRDELGRQRDLLRNVWKWYLLPFVPGMAIFLLGLYQWTMEQPNAPTHARVIMITFALTAAGCALVLVGVGELNRWGARKIQSKIDALNQLEKEA